MRNATDENPPAGTETRAVQPNEGNSGRRTYSCPSWCIDRGECRGEHVGWEWGTVATGGLPPSVGGVEPPTYSTAVVRAQHAESDGLAAGVALYGSGQHHDWQVDLTLREAYALLGGLKAAIAEAESV